MDTGLALEDLPEGFLAMSAQELSNLQQGAPPNAITFGFANETIYQAVMGYLIPYHNRAEQTAFDAMMPDMLDLFANAYGATMPPETIPGLEDLGTARAASTFVTGSGSSAEHWDIILFRRNETGVFLFNFYPDGDEPAASTVGLARLLDDRLSQKLVTLSVERASIWRDDFDAVLSPPWRWINENPARWSLAERPGYLRIFVSPYVFGQENGLLRPVTGGNFTIQTHVLFEPDTNFQIAGLIIYQDANNRLALGRAFCDIPNNCVGNGIYFDNVQGGNLAGTNFATSVDSYNEAYLRLERRGDLVTAFYSSDGVTWFEIGTHRIALDFRVNGVGLIACQDFNTPGRDIPADFDFFVLSEDD